LAQKRFIASGAPLLCKVYTSVRSSSLHRFWTQMQHASAALASDAFPQKMKPRFIFWSYFDKQFAACIFWISNGGYYSAKITTKTPCGQYK